MASNVKSNVTAKAIQVAHEFEFPAKIVFANNSKNIYLRVRLL